VRVSNCYSQVVARDLLVWVSDHCVGMSQKGPVNVKNEIACVILHEEDYGSMVGNLG